MIKRIEYINLEEREQILIDNSLLYLIEEQNITEGNFLIFSDTPTEVIPIYVDVTKQEMDIVKTRLADVEMALADIFTGGMI